MKRVLVTGATGCVGRHVVTRLLERNWEVHAVTSKPAPAANSAVAWHSADLHDVAQIASLTAEVRASHLLHLAWYVAPGKWMHAPENVDWLHTSLRLLRAFCVAGGRRLVTSGTCLEYDWSHGYCAESRTPHRSDTLYATCKHALHLLSTAITKNEGVSSAWGRVFFFYGPGEHPDRLVPSVINALLNGEPARCSHGQQVRDYLHVQDVADAFVELLEHDVTGPVNIGSGRRIQLREIVNRLGELMGRSDLIRLGAIPAAATDTPLVVADMTHAFSVLNWRPSIGLDEGLLQTINWWRQRMSARVLTSA